jgi:hypothetical protein
MVTAVPWSWSPTALSKFAVQPPAVPAFGRPIAKLTPEIAAGGMIDRVLPVVMSSIAIVAVAGSAR